MSTAAPLVPVVCALILREGRVLLAQRPAGKHLARCWEFPGGKVEPGEDPEQAIVREIREELGCDIVVGQALPRSRHRYERGEVELIPYLCQLSEHSPEPQAIEHEALAWVPPEQVLSYEMAPADEPVVEAWLALRTE